MTFNQTISRGSALLVLLIVPRFAFLSLQEHPEARYTVEFFALILAVGGVALAGLSIDRIRAVLGRKPSQEFLERRSRINE